MTRLARFQRVALLAASTTVITGGVLLPTSAFAAPSTPPAAASAAVGDAAAHWTQATDDPSGVMAELPGHAQMQKYTVNGYQGRAYQVETDYGAIGFVVYDAPHGGGQWDLKGSLKNALANYNKSSRSADDRLTSHDVRVSATDSGQPVLDADLSTGDGTAGHTRFVDLGDHLVQIEVLGTKDAQKTMDADYRQSLSSLQLPSGTTTRSS
ncbi:hypothetical protein [Streptomyces sp. NPDC101165]|uniref:hypothetical protein n=1 Tax=Streptomyces sp. NPDC101165 TaxID=3366119 RepID=UPI00381B4EC0